MAAACARSAGCAGALDRPDLRGRAPSVDRPIVGGRPALVGGCAALEHRLGVHRHGASDLLVERGHDRRAQRKVVDVFVEAADHRFRWRSHVHRGGVGRSRRWVGGFGRRRRRGRGRVKERKR